MIPKAYTSQIPRSQVFSIVCVIGLLQMLCSVLEPKLQPHFLSHAAALISMACFLAGTVFFGYRAFLPGAVLAFVVRLGELNPLQSFQLTVRDVIGAAVLVVVWKTYRFVRPESRHHPFVSKEFEAVLSAIPDVLIVFDREGRYREVFTGNHDLLIRPVDQLIGRRLHDFLDSKIADEAVATIGSVIDSGISVSREHRLKILGESKWFSARIVPFDLRGERSALWASREITQLKTAVEQQRKDETLLRNLLRLQDRERKLISCEMHDGILQHVIVASLMAQLLARDVDPKDKKVAASLTTLQTTLSDAIREGRGMIQDLRPLIVDDNGIIDALSGLVHEENQRDAFDISFSATGDFEDISRLLEGSIYRITQEALNNIRRHSRADSANISLVKQNDTVELRIQDNGVGFDNSYVRTESFGLKSIRNRAELFGGHARIESSPGNGTNIFVRLPYTAC